jgi:hypothetical protein
VYWKFIFNVIGGFITGMSLLWISTTLLAKLNLLEKGDIFEPFYKTALKPQVDEIELRSN